MKKNKLLNTGLSVFVAALNILPSINLLNASAKEYSPYYIRTEAQDPNISITISSETTQYDVNGDGKCDYKDAVWIEDYINGRYEVYRNEYSNINNANLPPLDIIDGFEKYDITGNGSLTVDDYCVYLKALQQNYDYCIDTEEMTATITGYNKKEDNTIVVPAEIYDQGTDRIYPVAVIAKNAFKDCNNLTRIEFFDYVIPNWVDEDGNPIENKGSVSASTVLKISNGAFEGCSHLIDIVLPSHVSIESDALKGTDFESEHGDVIDGIKVYRGSPDRFGRSTVLAYDIESNYVIQDGKLTIPSEVNAINIGFMSKSEYKDMLKSIIFKRIPEFIGSDAFQDCSNLTCVSGENNISEKQCLQLVRRYIPAFNGTPFIVNETQKKLDVMINNIKNTPGFYYMSDKDKALVAAKYLVNNTFYRTYSTQNTEFSLYPNNLYYTLDMSREAIYSGHSAMNAHFTECEGISKAYSLILDCLGITNLLMGEPSHALNQVYVNDTWYKVDLTGLCDNRCSEIRNAGLASMDNFEALEAKIALNDSSVVAGMDYSIFSDQLSTYPTLTSWAEYDLFDNSKGLHITNGDKLYFVYDPNNRSKLYITAFHTSRERLVSYEEIKQNLEKHPELEGKVECAYVHPGKNEIFGTTYYLDRNCILLTQNFFDEYHRFRYDYNRLPGNNWIVFHNNWFVTDSNSRIVLVKDGKNIIVELEYDYDRDYIYAYDIDNNPLTGKYYWPYSDEYSWEFNKDGVLIGTNANY